MAQMFPDVEKLGKITSINKSEIEFYDLLKNSEHTSNWKVFYSKIIKFKYKTREVDFIIFIPNEGIVLVELKANNPIRISQDEFVYNYHGVEKAQENPFRKIKNTAHQFKTTLNLSEEEKNKVFVSSIVVFPKLKFEFDLSICEDELNYLNSKVKYKDIPFYILTKFKDKKRKEENRIGANASHEEINKIMDKIFEKFVKTKEIKIESGDEYLEDIEDNAKRSMINCYQSISNLRRVFIDAPCSGGKSFFALQQIINKRSDPNFKIAYLCRSKHQFEKMKYSFQKTGNVDISTYDLLSALPKQRYDFVIMDDFSFDKNAISKINDIIDGGVKNGNLWILTDTEDKKNELQSFLSEFNFKDFYVKFSLNFRNNIAVSDFINEIMEKEVYSDNLFEYYNDINFVSYSDSGFESKFEDVIFSLLNKEKFLNRDIKILSLKKDIKESALFPVISRKKWARSLKEYSRGFDDGLSYSLLEDFMGLDSKAVILIDADNTVRDLQTELYKGASRARQRLIIMFKENTAMLGGYL